MYLFALNAVVRQGRNCVFHKGWGSMAQCPPPALDTPVIVSVKTQSNMTR